MSAKAPPSDTANWAWLRSWAATVDRKLNLIMLALKEIGTTGTISPELEEAFNELEQAVQTLDNKIPDQQKKGKTK